MLLKRIYKKRQPRLSQEKLNLPEPKTGVDALVGVTAIVVESLLKDKNTGEALEIDYISLAHTGIHKEQNFSKKLVVELMTLGIMEIKDETLVLHVHPEDLLYKIKRRPGRYCLHCGEKLPDDEKGELARLHVLEKHCGLKSPDPNNPSGYIYPTHFECVLELDQHEKYKVKNVTRAPKFYMKEATNG